MLKQKKLNLDELQVDSFITSVQFLPKTVLGGFEESDGGSCAPQETCDPWCTYNSCNYSCTCPPAGTGGSGGGMSVKELPEGPRSSCC